MKYLLSKLPKILLLLMCTSMFLYVDAQKNDELLQSKLIGKTNLREIMEIVDEHYDYGRAPWLNAGPGSVDKPFENDYLHWKRWEWYHESRLDENGNIIRNLNLKIWNEYNTFQLFSPIANRTNSSYGSWAAYGPTGITRYGQGYNSGYGRVNCIAFHPSNADILYIGTPQGGIWKTLNHGLSWFNLTDEIPACGISGLVVDRTNENIIYALTGDGDGSGGLVQQYGFAQPSLGVLKSVDAGITWQQTGAFPGVVGTFYGYKLIQHPTVATTLFAVTTQGIYRTANSGTTWTQEQTGNFTDIEFKPGTAATMYAAQKGGTNPFWISTNSGLTWDNTGTTGDPTSSGRIAIGVSVNNANYVYLVAGPATGSGSFKGLFRSTNSGVTFSPRSTTPNILGYPNDGSDNQDQDTYDLAIEVDPNDVNELVTGGINIWHSADGGTTYGGIARTQWYDDVLTIDYVHADIHNLTYSPLNGRLYTVSDGGVGFSTNDGLAWTFISGSLQLLATYHADWYELNENIIACGAQDNGTNIRYTTSNTYRHIYGADGFDCVIKDDNSDVIVYIANGSVNRTTNGGLNVTGVSPTGVGFFACLARDFNNNQIIYAADGTDLWKSTNFGTSTATWDLSSAGLGSRALTTCPSNSSRLYGSNGTTTLRSDNATATAALITYSTISGNPGYPTLVNCTDIAVRPSNSLDIYASFGGYSAGKKVYFSTDGGANWSNVSGSLPNVACHSVVVDKNNAVYVGTDVGVFVRSTTMTDWQPFYNFLPKAPVSELIVNNTTDRIIACTFGRGNFYTDLYSTCPLNLTLTGVLSGNRFYNASDFIVSTNTVTQGVGNSAALSAGNYVRLDPGFEVKNSSTFIAYNNPCGTGGIPLRITNINETIPMETAYISAEEGKRFPNASITSITQQNDGAKIHVNTAGNYSLRITDKQGKVVKLVVLNKALGIGETIINWNRSEFQAGFYYVQLLKDNSMVHFQELDIRK